MNEPSVIEEYMMVSESRAVLVLLWLLKNRNKDNTIYTTLDAVASDCNVTKVTVNRVFQKLYKKNLMKRVRNGQYQLEKV